MKVSVLIPTFNEEKTIKEIIDKSKNNSKYEVEIIVINDGSTDDTSKMLNSLYSNDKSVKILENEKNYGKGFSIRKGIENSTGDILIIQDADLEYDPSQHNRLIDPIVNNLADVVYGSRFVGNDPHRVIYYFNRIANSFLTSFSNILSNLNLSDMETGLKAFRKKNFENISLKENGFGIEPELTIKLAKKKLRFYEVGISYYGRT